MAGMPISAVIFDFDGVIADTERLHLAAFQDAFASRSWTLDERDYFDRYIGFDDRGLMAAYADDRRLTLADDELRELLHAKKKAFSRHLNSAEILYPGAKAAIEAIAARFPIAIASGALHHEIVGILTAGGLNTLFSVVVGADDVAATKPAPDPYLAAAARLGIAPGECVAIEDSAAGLQAARSAGMHTIAVTTTAPIHALSAADRVMSGLAEITPEIVAGLGL
jgi:beta-phosphoglucomutase